MKGYFTRKPMNIEEVKAAIREGRRQGLEPVEIEPVGRIVLTLDEYIAFCDALLKDRGFPAQLLGGQYIVPLVGLAKYLS